MGCQQLGPLGIAFAELDVVQGIRGGVEVLQRLEVGDELFFQVAEQIQVGLPVAGQFLATPLLVDHE